MAVQELGEEGGELLELLQLNGVPGLGPRMLQVLLASFGTPSAILNATGGALLSVHGVGAKLSAAITKSGFDRSAIERERQRCEEMGIALVPQSSEQYSKLLLEIPDPPLLLYRKGTWDVRDAIAVAIVGSRRCSHYGRQQAERLAEGLARAGVTVVSGLARGIDTAAHIGALRGKGRTIAVCAQGLSHMYPPENKKLADQIAESGAVITESPLDRSPSRGLFPQRNRIISGMSLGVIVVEASQKSGSLYTARHAMEQGRDVFAVPGQIDRLESEGCHNLIRDGVALIRNVDDVLESLGPLMEPIQRTESETILVPRELNLTEQERAILNLLTQEPQIIDTIIAAASIEPSRVLATLTMLEMKRVVQRMPGNAFARRVY